MCVDEAKSEACETKIFAQPPQNMGPTRVRNLPIYKVNICNPFDIQQTFVTKIHLLYWEAENTGKGGR